MDELTIERLRAFHNRGMELRQLDTEERAFDYLKTCYGVIRDDGILKRVPQTQEEVERYSIACEVVLEYAATCTQHAFNKNDGEWHKTAVGIEDRIRKLSTTAIPAMPDGLDPTPIFRELHRAGNSLGVSYQRPKELFDGRDTEKAIKLTKEASRYYGDWAKEIISRSAGGLSEQDKADILNAIRYCGNYAAALYQRAEDLKKKAPEEAIELYNQSIAERVSIEKNLISPLFTSTSLKYFQSVTQRAGTYQAIAILSKGEKRKRGIGEAKKLYGEAIEGISALERSESSGNSDGGCVTYQNARLGAQFGLAWCFFNGGEYEEALKKHKAVFDERRALLGSDHVDTVKSLRAMNTVKAAIYSAKTRSDA